MIPHAKEISDISKAKWKELKGWFWDDFITCFPPRPAPRSLLSERIYPDFSLIQLKMGAEVLSLPNMFLQRPKKKASRQIKAKKILNLLITQLNCAVTDRGNEHIFIRALWYEWGVKRETQRGNQEQLQGDGEWIKRRNLSLNRIPACTSPSIFLWGDWGPACRHVMKGGTTRGPVNYAIWHPKLWSQTIQLSRNLHLLLKILRTIRCCQGDRVWQSEDLILVFSSIPGDSGSVSPDRHLSTTELIILKDAAGSRTFSTLSPDSLQTCQLIGNLL